MQLVFWSDTEIVEKFSKVYNEEKRSVMYGWRGRDKAYSDHHLGILRGVGVVKTLFCSFICIGLFLSLPTALNMHQDDQSSIGTQRKKKNLVRPNWIDKETIVAIMARYKSFSVYISLRRLRSAESTMVGSRENVSLADNRKRACIIHGGNSLEGEGGWRINHSLTMFPRLWIVSTRSLMMINDHRVKKALHHRYAKITMYDM